MNPTNGKGMSFIGKALQNKGVLPPSPSTPAAPQTPGPLDEVNQKLDAIMSLMTEMGRMMSRGQGGGQPPMPPMGGQMGGGGGGNPTGQ